MEYPKKDGLRKRIGKSLGQGWAFWDTFGRWLGHCLSQVWNIVFNIVGNTLRLIHAKHSPPRLSADTLTHKCPLAYKASPHDFCGHTYDARMSTKHVLSSWLSGRNQCNANDSTTPLEKGWNTGTDLALFSHPLFTIPFFTCAHPMSSLKDTSLRWV